MTPATRIEIVAAFADASTIIYLALGLGGLMWGVLTWSTSSVIYAAVCLALAAFARALKLWIRQP